MGEAIRYRSSGGLARITLDRPPLNVLTTEMLLALDQALQRAAADGGTRVVRLDAVGPTFSAGVDVADHVGPRVEPMLAALSALFATLARIDPPTVSVVQGAALGGGAELVLGTDLCYASRRASFGLPEIRLGVFAPPASVLLPRRIGERRALELLLTGESVDALEAQRIGLVNAVFEHERLESEVEGRLDRLLGLSGAALGLAKQAVRIAADLPTAQAHAAVQALYADRLMSTADAAEGLAAFLGKRAPRWTHR